jgi:hypothetical protein
MSTSLLALLITLGSIPRSRLDLQVEILALRHQIGVLDFDTLIWPVLTENSVRAENAVVPSIREILVVSR